MWHVHAFSQSCDVHSFRYLSDEEEERVAVHIIKQQMLRNGLNEEAITAFVSDIIREKVLSGTANAHVLQTFSMDKGLERKSAGPARLTLINFRK